MLINLISSIFCGIKGKNLLVNFPVTAGQGLFNSSHNRVRVKHIIQHVPMNSYLVEPQLVSEPD